MHVRLQQVGDHLRGDGMVRGPARHLRFDHNFVLRFRHRSVEGRTDIASPIDQHRLVVGLPRGVPVLVLHRGHRPGYLHLGKLRIFQQILEDILVIVSLGNIAQQLVLLVAVHETVAPGVGHQRGIDLLPRV